MALDLAVRRPRALASLLLVPALVLLPFFPLAGAVASAGEPCPHRCQAIRLLQSDLLLRGVRESVAAEDDAMPYLAAGAPTHELLPGLKDTTGARLYPRYLVLDCVDGKPYPYVTGWRDDLVASLGDRYLFFGRYGHGAACDWAVWISTGPASAQ